ncbi:MAG: type IV pilin [Methanomicrobiales archaeon]|jgi:flagellin-like protein|nr:type IV pilin [Methanomicrobiales archaeon]
MKAIRNEEEAVSPVIGVILMVAIVVILAAVIAAFVFGMTGTVQGSKSIAATARYVGPDSVEVTYQGGTDHVKLEYLILTINGVSYNSTATDPFYSDTEAGLQPAVGTKFLFADEEPVTENTVVVVGRFSDGADQVILDQRV